MPESLTCRDYAANITCGCPASLRNRVRLHPEPRPPSRRNHRPASIGIRTLTQQTDTNESAAAKVFRQRSATAPRRAIGSSLSTYRYSRLVYSGSTPISSTWSHGSISTGRSAAGGALKRTEQKQPALVVQEQAIASAGQIGGRPR
jgi:hypothetical protein